MKRFALAVGALCAAAAASALTVSAALPKGFPAVWTVVQKPPAGIAANAGTLMGVVPGSGGSVTIHTVDTLGAGGQRGYAYTEFKLRRVKGGTVTCGGQTYHGPYTEDLRGRV